MKSLFLLLIAFVFSFTFLFYFRFFRSKYQRTFVVFLFFANRCKSSIVQIFNPFFFDFTALFAGQLSEGEQIPKKTNFLPLVSCLLHFQLSVEKLPTVWTDTNYQENVVAKRRNIQQSITNNSISSLILNIHHIA